MGIVIEIIVVAATIVGVCTIAVKACVSYIKGRAVQARTYVRDTRAYALTMGATVGRLNECEALGRAYLNKRTQKTQWAKEKAITDKIVKVPPAPVLW